MMQEIDLWRAAKILIDAHGKDAQANARERVEAAIEEGDPLAAAIWAKVVCIIADLQKETPAPGRPLN